MPYPNGKFFIDPQGQTVLDKDGKFIITNPAGNEQCLVCCPACECYSCALLTFRRLKALAPGVGANSVPMTESQDQWRLTQIVLQGCEMGTETVTPSVATGQIGISQVQIRRAPNANYIQMVKESHTEYYCPEGSYVCSGGCYTLPDCTGGQWVGSAQSQEVITEGYKLYIDFSCEGGRLYAALLSQGSCNDFQGWAAINTQCAKYDPFTLKKITDWHCPEGYAICEYSYYDCGSIDCQPDPCDYYECDDYAERINDYSCEWEQVAETEIVVLPIVLRPLATQAQLNDTKSMPCILTRRDPVCCKPEGFQFKIDAHAIIKTFDENENGRIDKKQIALNITLDDFSIIMNYPSPYQAYEGEAYGNTQWIENNEVRCELAGKYVSRDYNSSQLNHRYHLHQKTSDANPLLTFSNLTSKLSYLEKDNNNKPKAYYLQYTEEGCHNQFVLVDMSDHSTTGKYYDLILYVENDSYINYQWNCTSTVEYVNEDETESFQISINAQNATNYTNVITLISSSGATYTLSYYTTNYIYDEIGWDVIDVVYVYRLYRAGVLWATVEYTQSTNSYVLTRQLNSINATVSDGVFEEFSVTSNGAVVETTDYHYTVSNSTNGDIFKVIGNNDGTEKRNAEFNIVLESPDYLQTGNYLQRKIYGSFHCVMDLGNTGDCTACCYGQEYPILVTAFGKNRKELYYSTSSGYSYSMGLQWCSNFFFGYYSVNKEFYYLTVPHPSYPNDREWDIIAMMFDRRCVDPTGNVNASYNPYGTSVCGYFHLYFGDTLGGCLFSQGHDLHDMYLDPDTTPAAQKYSVSQIQQEYTDSVVKLAKQKVKSETPIEMKVAQTIVQYLTVLLNEKGFHGCNTCAYWNVFRENIAIEYLACNNDMNLFIGYIDSIRFENHLKMLLNKTNGFNKWLNDNQLEFDDVIKECVDKAREAWRKHLVN
jgi:hypothetical protein